VATAQLPDGSVVDGEVVVWEGDRLKLWPTEIGTGHFGAGDRVAITRVEPLVVVEVNADTGPQGEVSGSPA
jgi:hypothetical protein